MAPPLGRDVGQELGVYRQAVELPLSDGFAEMHSIPVNHNGGEQVEPSHAVVLALAGAVSDFALAPDAEGIYEGVMSLVPVKAGSGPALYIGIQQAVDDKEGAFDPSDFAQSDGRFVLAGIGRELSQQRAGG